MKKEVKDNPITFGIRKFEIKAFSFQETAVRLLYKDNPSSTVLDFTITPEVKISDVTKALGIFLIIEVVYKSEGKIEEVGKFYTSTEFNIVNLDDLKIPSSNPPLYDINDKTIRTFVSIAYSTTRGALLVKGSGTILGHVPMPVVDPAILIRQREASNESKIPVLKEEKQKSKK